MITNKTVDEIQIIVLGTRVPIILTSRADSAEARLASCAVAAAFAYRLRENRNINQTVQE